MWEEQLKKIFLISHPRRSPNGPPETPSKERGLPYKGIATSIIVAIATAAIGYTVGFVDAHRKAQIEKVDRQIEKLYGPLYAYSVTSGRAWRDSSWLSRIRRCLIPVTASSKAIRRSWTGVASQSRG